MMREDVPSHDTLQHSAVHDLSLPQDEGGEGHILTSGETDGSVPDDAAATRPARAAMRDVRHVPTQSPRADLSSTLSGSSDAPDVGSDGAGATGDLAAITNEIRTRLRRAASDIVDIGANLLRAKDLVGHGSFGAYLKREFDMSERTAERYMVVARRFEGNSDIVSNLPQALVYRLAAKSTPEAVITEVIERVRLGRPMNSEDVQGRLSAARAGKSGATKQKAALPVDVAPQGDKARAETPDQARSRLEAAREAARLLEERLGEDLPKLLNLLADCDLDQVLKILVDRRDERR